MAVYRSLQSLIKAFNITPAAGQTLHNTVPGASSGAGITSYKLDDWNNWQSTDASGTHANGSSIHFTFDFVANDHWMSYLRVPSVTGMTAFLDISSDPAGRNASITGGQWSPSGNLSGNQITVQLNGRALNGSYSGGSGILTLVRNYYKFYTSPDYPVGSSGDEVWEIIMSMNSGTYAPPTLTSDTQDLVIQYPATLPHSNGLPFNDVLSHRTAVTVQGYDAGPPPNNTPMMEWHTNSTFTSLYSTDNPLSFVVNSSNPSGSFWLRSRLSTSDAWISFAGNPVTYHDKRY